MYVAAGSGNLAKHLARQRLSASALLLLACWKREGRGLDSTCVYGIPTRQTVSVAWSLCCVDSAGKRLETHCGIATTFHDAYGRNNITNREIGLMRTATTTY